MRKFLGELIRSAEHSRHIVSGLSATERFTRRIHDGMVPGVPRDIPIVALAAYALAGDHERFLAADMDDYLSKPISMDDLEAVLARVIVR